MIRKSKGKRMSRKIFFSVFAMTIAAFVLGAGLVLCFVYVGGTDTFVGIVLAMAVASALATIPAMWMASWLSERITQPINDIDPRYPEKAEVYDELTPLVQRMSAQNLQIMQHMASLTESHEKQDAMRREFTANVSHELKTPLTSIAGYAELIRDGIARPEDVSRFAGKICEESQRLITLVGDIIKLSQLDDKEIQVEIEEIDLYEICAAVLSHLERAAEKKQVRCTLTGDHPVIRGAALIVEEIIFNLCDNAIKYNREGGSVTVSLRRYADGVELSVTDTGIGIPHEDIERVFERFYRVDKSHSKEIGGTGLGLSIVKHGARFLGATVSLESTLGLGTTVRVLF